VVKREILIRSMKMEKRQSFWSKERLGAIVVLGTIISTLICGTGLAVENAATEHYKMLSTVEYSGQGQFKHQVETLVKVKKEVLSDDKAKYSISTKDFDIVGTALEPGQEPATRELSFVIDGESNRVSSGNTDLVALEKISNHCAKSLKQVTKKNVGKTWKQSFNLASFGHPLPKKLNLTLTAKQVKTNMFGEMIAVRALSEPFVVRVIRVKEGKYDVKNAKSRIRTVYLFDSEINDVYLSISVFEITANINAPNEKLRHEVATYKTNAQGVPVDFSGLGKEFENFVRKVGLTSQNLKVEKQTPLPEWARLQGLPVGQVSNICAALACEGALNPVATIWMASARTVELQSGGRLASASKIGNISSILAKNIPGMGGMKIAVAPAAIMGMSANTAATVAGATVGTVAIAGGFDSDGHGSRSPSTP
jgi:hypothetical protein